MTNHHKPTKSLCGNLKHLVWKIIPVGINEFHIQNNSGQMLTNKDGKNKSGNPIIAVKPLKPGRDLSNIWSFTPLGNGEWIIYNPGTKKCLDTTNKTNEGSGYKLMTCAHEKKNNNQLFSFNIVKPEFASKIKSDPEI